MTLHTTSEVISLADKLESELAGFYEELSRKYEKDKNTFLSIAKENRNNVRQITRTYQEVITDAIEGCFAFNMNPEDYAFLITPSKEDSYSQALNKVIAMEERVLKFYSDATIQSKTLLADVPRTFAGIVRKKETRIRQLKLLI